MAFLLAQSSAAIRTFNPSIASVKGSWHDRREVSSRSVVEIEQIVLVLAHRGQVARRDLDMDVAGGAAAAAAAQREQFVETRVADIFHHGQAGVALDLMFGPVARHHNQLGHARPHIV